MQTTLASGKTSTENCLTGKLNTVSERQISGCRITEPHNIGRRITECRKLRNAESYGTLEIRGKDTHFDKSANLHSTQLLVLVDYFSSAMHNFLTS